MTSLIRSRRRRRRPAVAALVVAVLSVAASCSPGGHHKPVVPPSTASTTTSTIPPATSSPYSWDRVKSGSLALGGGATSTLSALIAPQFEGPWQAFGTRFSATGSPTATVWSSPDTQAWSSAPLGSDEPASQANGADVFRGTTVVVGATGAGAGEQAAAWYARGGAAFSAATIPVTDGPSSINEVTAGALGYFATGTVDGHLAVWESTDGRTWAEVANAERVVGSQPGATVNALLSVGDSVYAAGWVEPGAVPQAAVWTSTDGLDWKQVDTATSSFSGPYGEVIYSLSALSSASSGGSGLVAVGAIDGGSGWEPASWISPNGVSWSLPSTDFPASPKIPTGATDLGPSGGSAALSVRSVPTLDGSSSIVATGGGPYGQAAWKSVDGLHWASLSMPAAYSGSGAWSAGLVATTAATTVVADPQPGQPYLLTDTGGAWNEPSPSAFGPIRAVAVPVSLRHAPSGLLLTVETVDRPATIGPPTLSVVTLTSTDGRNWRPATAPQVAQVQPATEPTTGALSVKTADGWLAVSTGPSAAPSAFRSPDGRTWTKEAVLPAPFATNPATSGADLPTTTTVAPSGHPPVTLLPRTEAPGYAVNGMCAFTPPATASGTSTTTARSDPTAAVAAVGAGQFVPSAAPTPTTAAAAWRRHSGHWTLAAVPQTLPSGSGQAMTGCLASGSSVYAFGSAASSSGATEPAIWHSADGASWSRLGVSAFGADDPAPLTSVATTGPNWVAVATPAPTAIPFLAGVFGAAGPGASLSSDAAFGPGPSTENGSVGLWTSTDGGSAWQLVDTTAAPWAGTQVTQLDLTAFTGTGTPVVVGSIDGGLAVWAGVAATEPAASEGGAQGPRP